MLFFGTSSASMSSRSWVARLRMSFVGYKCTLLYSIYSKGNPRTCCADPEVYVIMSINTYQRTPVVQVASLGKSIILLPLLLLCAGSDTRLHKEARSSKSSKRRAKSNASTNAYACAPSIVSYRALNPLPNPPNPSNHHHAPFYTRMWHFSQ